MPTLIPAPVRVEAAGNKPKLIDEYVGRLATGHQALSVAHMRSPGGWVEPGQTPEFDEFTVVLTCPSDWGRLRRTVLLDAARLAGIADPMLVDEPVAAAADADPPARCTSLRKCSGSQNEGLSR